MSSGFEHATRHTDTDWQEHGAQGDLSTGRKFKHTKNVTMSFMFDEVDSTTTYIGEAKPGTATSDALWRIKKITISGSVTSFSFADGNDSYDNVWDDRASLTYI